MKATWANLPGAGGLGQGALSLKNSSGHGRLVASSLLGKSVGGCPARGEPAGALSNTTFVVMETAYYCTIQYGSCVWATEHLNGASEPEKRKF